ncbi:papain-like cysteine protease family protein [Roseicella frigidaeris]|nr:papain-like cysteine protease family protein [Roseicella frigidaeris]
MGGAIWPFASDAALRCTPFGPNGIQACEAGLTLGGAREAKQEHSFWCWAACIESVFRFHGFNVRQEKIVARVFDYAANVSANGPQIVRAIDGDWVDEGGENFSATSEVLWDSQFFFGRLDAVSQAAQQLVAGNPLIIGALGHATVLTAMTYIRDLSGRGTPLSLTVRDPWPGRQSPRILGADEAMQAQFLAAISVERF